MATGWAHEGAVLDQIDDTITDGEQNARARLPQGSSALECVEWAPKFPGSDATPCPALPPASPARPVATPAPSTR